MKLKRPQSWALVVVVNLCILEIACRGIFFQFKSEYSFAMVEAYQYVVGALSNPVPTGPVGIWTKDPKYGFAHIADSSGTHELPCFTAEYTIGPDKERFAPVPEHPKGRILFLGGSFTFGHGVNDDQPFPYLLAKRLPDWEVVNKTVMGWGTSHAYMTLEEELRKKQPSLVVYVMIHDHIQRNYIRRSWVEGIAEYGGFGHPHFELVNGEPVFQGVIGPEESLPDSPEVLAREIELTNAFLSSMQEMCSSRKIPFVVVFLSGPKMPAEITAPLAEQKISVLDLTDLYIEGFPCDGHPNALDHQRIADAISGSFIPRLLPGERGGEFFGQVRRDE